MHSPYPHAAFRPAISRSDWALIANALIPYSHNSEYRDLLDRLGQQMSGLDQQFSASPDCRTGQARTG